MKTFIGDSIVKNSSIDTPPSIDKNISILDSAVRNAYIDDLELLITKYTQCKNLHSEEDTEICKRLLTIMNKIEIPENFILKICSLIICRFTDGRYDFNDRGCFLATELFKKDCFNIAEKQGFNDFKEFITVKLTTKKKTTSMNPEFEVVKNERAYLSHLDYSYSNAPYTCTYNPKFIQKGLKILKEDKDLNAVRSVHFNFKEMLEFTTDRLFSCVAPELFTQLTDLTHRELFEIQFKNLAYLMARDELYFEKALDMFVQSKSETLKTFLIYSFYHCQEVVPYEYKIKLHLRFAEVISVDQLILEPTVREAAIRLVEVGLDILRKYEAN